MYHRYWYRGPIQSRANRYIVKSMHWYRTPEEMRTIGALGGSASGQSKRDLKPWQRAMLTTRATLARAYPDNPILRMDQVHIAQLLEASWKAGYRAGAGRAPK